MDSSRELRAVLRAWRWLALFAIVAAGAAYGASTLQDKVYVGESTARIVAGEQSPAAFSAQSLEVLTATYAELARSDRVFQAAARALKGRRAPASEIDDVSSIDSDEIGVLQLTSEAATGDDAARFATAYAQGFARVVAQEGEGQRRRAVARIERRIDRLRERLADLPSGNGEAAGLLNEVQELSSSSANLSAREPDTVRIIQEARVPGGPASPKPLRNSLVALFIALILGGAVAYLRASLSGRYDSPEEVSRDLEMPVLGELPRADADDPAARDAFRAFRTNLEFAMKNGRPKLATTGAVRKAGGAGAGRTLLVTSPDPGAGKTYIVAGLAQALAASGERAVAVDADLRRPALHQRLNLTVGPGVADVVDDPEREPATRSVDLPPSTSPRGHNLKVLTAGRAAEDSAEMLATPAMRELVEGLSSEFEVVVVDSPPALGITDAAVLTRYVDAVVLVIDRQRTKRRAARRAKVALRAVGAPVVGLVFNRIPPNESAYYQYGYQREDGS